MISYKVKDYYGKQSDSVFLLVYMHDFKKIL